MRYSEGQTLEPARGSFIRKASEVWETAGLAFSLGRKTALWSAPRRRSRSLLSETGSCHIMGKAALTRLRQTTVRAIIHKWQKHGAVVNLPRSGRPTKITPRVQRRLIQEVTKDPTTTSKEPEASPASVKWKFLESLCRLDWVFGDPHRPVSKGFPPVAAAPTILPLKQAEGKVPQFIFLLRGQETPPSPRCCPIGCTDIPPPPRVGQGEQGGVDMAG
ncbi:hypothetical protein NFI96_003988 [Prochilodus magdalenae]|nr:hypothetical protein NFI96_003988 [Prochilodus magdalenae]